MPPADPTGDGEGEPAPEAVHSIEGEAAAAQTQDTAEDARERD